MAKAPKKQAKIASAVATGDGTVLTVGKYRIDEVIGRGAVGIVYRGFDPTIERPVALKTLRPDILDEVGDRKQLLERFGREARSAGRCQHPNIVTVYDYVEHDEAPFIVMEFVAAGTLDNITRSGIKLPLRQVGEVMVQLLSALAHAHSKNVVHRDVKPANILCPAASSIKVTDFGVARLSDLNVTRPGGSGALGTPNYMSPEQFLGRPVDARADIFAAGVILFQLLTGTKPFAATDLPDLMRKLLNDTAPPVSAFRPELRQLDAVMAEALARNPVDRFQSADKFMNALTTAIDGCNADSTPPLDLTVVTRDGHGDRSDTTTGSDLSRTMAERLTPGTLKAVEDALARSIGPIARLLLKRAAQESNDAERLLSTLCAQIPREVEAKDFRQRAERWLREDEGVAAVQLDAAISDTEIMRATAGLLPFIGPVARLLAERHAATAIGREDYYEHLARTITNPSDRKKFLDAHSPTSSQRKS